MEKENVEKMNWLADSMLDNFPGCIMRVSYTNNEMNLVYVSDGIKKIAGVSPEEYAANFQQYAKGWVDSDNTIWGKEFLDEAERTGQGLRKEFDILDVNGERHWIEIRSTLVERSEDTLLMQYVMLDIHDQKRAEEQAKKEHERLVVVAGMSADSVFEYDIKTDCMRYYNENEVLVDTLRHTPVVENYTQRILDGTMYGELTHPDDTEKMRSLCESLRSGIPEISVQMRKQYEPGKYVWISVDGKTMLDKHGIPSHVIGKISNIDEIVRKEQEEKSRLERDPMTGLYNRDKAEHLIAERLRESSAEPAYLLLSDIDRFMGINNVMGRLFGDGVICTFANSIVEIFPECIVGRIGGDEFVVYIEGVEEEEILARTARINRRLSRIHAGAEDELKISASFGLAKCVPGRSNRLDRLLHEADVALCHIKQKSGGKAAIYEKFMEKRHIHKDIAEVPEADINSKEAVIHTEGDMMLFAHELFENTKDIKGALRLISDVVTRFYHFQDILYVHKRSSGKFEIVFHWGEHNTDQFYQHPLSPAGEPDWEKLLYTNPETEYVVLLENDFIGENVNRAKSMVSFRISDKDTLGYCVLVDRQEKRKWKEEVPVLIKLGDFVVKRYFSQLEKQRKEEEAEYKSKYDRLTGMMNLTYFTSACEQYVKTHPEQAFSLLYTDFTNFKYFNEAYGYNEGNNILREYALFLKDSPAILQCRITADSFVSLFATDDIEELQQKFMERGEEFCEAAHQRYVKCKLGIAGGIAVLDRSLDSISLNIDNANMARKHVKKDATVHVFVYTDELRKEQQKQMEIVSHMAEALEKREFKVFLQPKMDMFTDKVVGAEALVRWFKEDGTMVPPGDFIQIFEENGFVTHLDFEMMRQVLEMQQKRLQEGKPIVKISVNFSRKHQESQSYLTRLDDLMAQYDVPAKSLEIEITESVFMQDLAPLIESICQLKQRGFSVSIDDFGAGYSSLNVLSRVKADIIKLDRQFLLDVERGRDNYTSDFLQIMVDMIKKLGFHVLAEGVETEEQVKMLKHAGCRLAQGYYYARPMPIADFLEFLENHSIEEV